MQIDFVYWVLAATGALFIVVMGRSSSVRVRFGVSLLGIGSVSVGLLFGLSGEPTSERLLSLLLFDKKQTALFGPVEYRLISTGYALLAGGILLSLRRSERLKGQ